VDRHARNPAYAGDHVGIEKTICGIRDMT
jgi:hypothetical protein